MEGPWRDIRGSTSWEPGAPAPDVYREVISGRPRMSGARAALEHYGVPDVAERVEAYAARKQAMVVELIEAGRFTAYPDALEFVLAVRAAGIRLATASSSKNARLLLGRIRLDVFARESGLTYDFVTPGLSLLGLIDVRRLRPPVRAGQAAPRHLPHGGRRARLPAGPLRRRRGCRLGDPGGHGRRDDRPRRRPGGRRPDARRRGRGPRRHVARPRGCGRPDPWPADRRGVLTGPAAVAAGP